MPNVARVQPAYFPYTTAGHELIKWCFDPCFHIPHTVSVVPITLDFDLQLPASQTIFTYLSICSGTAAMQMINNKAKVVSPS